MKILKRVILVVLLVIMSVGALFIGNGYNMYKEALKQMPLEEKIRSIREKENYTKIEEVPQMYINAVIAIEDHRFYKHKGIDVIAVNRALINDIKAMDFIEGGSTITQQVAKNIYFTQEKKFIRKIAEVFMASKIEKNYKKEEILELYINTSYYGDGYYTEPSEITDYECILLAGIPNAPSVYAPTKNPELAKQRQEQVMKKMIKYGYLTEEEANSIINEN